MDLYDIFTFVRPVITLKLLSSYLLNESFLYRYELLIACFIYFFTYSWCILLINECSVLFSPLHLKGICISNSSSMTWGHLRAVTCMSTSGPGNPIEHPIEQLAPLEPCSNLTTYPLSYFQ